MPGYRPYTLGSRDQAAAVAINGHYYRHRHWWMAAAAIALALVG